MRYLVGFVVILGSLLLAAQPASACSGAVPTVADHTNSAELVVIGTFAEATDDVIMLQVESFLKGAADSSELSINNHHMQVEPSCRSTLGRGDRFSEGTQVLAFLMSDTFDIGADWQPLSTGASAIFKIDGADLLHIATDKRFGSLQSALEEIEAAAGRQPTGHSQTTLAASTPMRPGQAQSDTDDAAADPRGTLAAPAPPLPTPSPLTGHQAPPLAANLAPTPWLEGPSPAPPVAQPHPPRQGVTEILPRKEGGAPSGRAAPQGSGAALTSSLPELALGFFIAVSIGLLAWAAAQIIRRQPLR